jgi:2-methylisocitrate lyase-like PEP mutase family enzyme
LDHWTQDRHLLADIGRRVSEFVQAPENYQHFMEQFHAGKRDEAALALEHFGDPAKDLVDEQAGLQLRAHSSYGLEQDYLIHDGKKLVLEPRIADLMRRIAESPGLPVSTWLEQSPVEDKQLLRELLTQFCRQEVLAVSDPAVTM